MFDGALSPLHLLLIIFALLLLFGPSRLPNLARSIGEAAREFRHGASEAHSATAETQAVESTSDQTTP